MAGPETSAARVRGRWHIENKLHRARDVTCLEDRALVKDRKRAPRHCVAEEPGLSLLHLDGHDNIAATPATRSGRSSCFKLHEYDCDFDF